MGPFTYDNAQKRCSIKKPLTHCKLRAFADRTVSSNLTQTPLKPSNSSDIKELQL
jgi:hypothetical protein